MTRRRAIGYNAAGNPADLPSDLEAAILAADLTNPDEARPVIRRAADLGYTRLITYTERPILGPLARYLAARLLAYALLGYCIAFTLTYHLTHL